MIALIAVLKRKSPYSALAHLVGLFSERSSDVQVFENSSFSMTTSLHSRITAFAFEHLLVGALELERTSLGLRPHRLPAWARVQANDAQLSMAESQPSGVRLEFCTEATSIELEVLPTRYVYIGAPARPAGVFDLLVDGQLTRQASAMGGHVIEIDIATGAALKQSGAPYTIEFHGLPAGVKQIQIWLPHNESVELTALRADAPLAPTRNDFRGNWIHYGSSISQGSNASSPTSTWPVIAASLGNAKLLNLGLSGSALLDPFIARVMRDTPADFISLKIGINLVNTDLMRSRAFTAAVHGFLDTLREGHFDIPLLVISPLYCPIHEDTPGPGTFDLEALADGEVRFKATGDRRERDAGKLTLQFIRSELHRIVQQRAAQDQHLHYIDGLTLYGASDFSSHPLPDALHPDAISHAFIGNRFASLAFGPGGFFGPTPLAL